MMAFLTYSIFMVLSIVPQCYSTNFYVGTGIADITGPAAELNMMGYANPSQISHGIHMRSFSRAFVFGTALDSVRNVFVNIDACWASGGVKREVIVKLNKLYNGLYTERNVAISGTHTHSGAGGFSQYLLFDITALGYNKQAFDALVNGITLSIVQAHKNFRPADIFVNSGELLESNINRSPSAYLNNPKEERANYKYDVDKTMTVLKIVDEKGQGMGMISWFAVHCTSMNNTNHLLSSDNKGYAGQQIEKLFNPGKLPGQGSFVAAFAQSNEGDVSPNTKGPHCINSGKPCDILTSTCDGKNEQCISFGPGKDMYESTKIIGTNQYKKALDLYNSASVKLEGKVDFRHTYTDMSKATVTLSNGTKVQTCKTAMGYSFAAGTTDGPGAFDFKQGTTTGNPFWDIVKSLIKDPSPEQIKCHHPKPILLDTGEISTPYAWQASIVDHQILRIGQFAIIAVPGEFSTMSGRRTRDAVTSTLIKNGLPNDTISVIAGLSNEYSDYITTFEEYHIQRYEGASTIYGPHTLAAHIDSYVKLAQDMAKGKTTPPGPSPPSQADKQISLLPGVVFDTAGFGNHFGMVLNDVQPNYNVGSVVTATFVTANPRNNLRTNDTFLTVERLNGNSWVVEYNDAQWETRFKWISTNMLLGESHAEISWEIPSDQKPGQYRIRHFGTSKSMFGGGLSNFVGQTKTFTVNSSRGLFGRYESPHVETA